MNIFSVIEAADKAGKYVREGNGPYIIEVQTYRYRGHSMSDPAKYNQLLRIEEALQGMAKYAGSSILNNN